MTKYLFLDCYNENESEIIVIVTHVINELLLLNI